MLSLFFSYNTSAFSSRRERTYEILLRDMFNQYSDGSGGNDASAVGGSVAGGGCNMSAVGSPPSAAALAMQRKNKEELAQVG
jgi:hypothetical protein